MRALLALDDIAGRIGVGADWLKRQMPRFYRIGFPRPLPLPGVQRWDPAALDRWLDRWLDPTVVPAYPAPRSRPANDTAPTIVVDDADRWAAIIDRRAAELAHGE
jgi:hypothetical protein